jgi:hypothetical protein
VYALPCPSQATTRQRRQLCCGLSTNSGSMALMPVGWMSLGDNNLAPRLYGDADGVKRALTQASRERTSKWRATESGPGTSAKPAA